MLKRFTIITLLFIILRIITINLYIDTNYYNGMVRNQFAIAEASYNGHDFSFDKKLVENVKKVSQAEKKYIPIEEWKNFEKSGIYQVFPPTDVPGLGYLIAFTSKYFGNELTSKYAFAIQLILELFSILIFSYSISLVFGKDVSFYAGLIYIFAYPFIWPAASQPMRDIFVLGVFSLYIITVLLFLKQNKTHYASYALLLAISAALLWIRPSAYYYNFLMSPLFFIAKHKSLKERLAMFVITIAFPILIFGIPFKQFNMKYYGVPDTQVTGLGLWEGMGIIKDNPYGFVLDDRILIPWAQKKGYNIKEWSPQLNIALGDYAKSVIKKDPVYYLKTVLVRIRQIIRWPLGVDPYKSFKLVSYTNSNLSIIQYIIKYPGEIIKSVIFYPKFGRIFFNCGISIVFIMLLTQKTKRLEIILLTSPVFYTLATQIPIHFEQRYLTMGAWVLILPFAWVINLIRSNFFTRQVY